MMEGIVGFKLADGCESNIVDGEYCVFNEYGDFASFNDVGQLIMQLIEQGLTEESIAEETYSRYDADLSSVKDDVALFLSDMKQRGFLEEALNED